MARIYFLFVFILTVSSFSSATPCHSEISNELQQMLAEDQKDRKPPIDWEQTAENDELRRARVEQIFADGCLHSSKDYFTAALIFQHGVVPEHFFRAFLWSKKSYELGGQPQAKRLMALTVDRYLVHSGHKQLFGSQAYKSEAVPCWCLDEVERTFPNEVRSFYFGKSIAEQLQWIQTLNKNSPECKTTNFCKRGLLESPRGTVPEFW